MLGRAKAHRLALPSCAKLCAPVFVAALGVWFAPVSNTFAAVSIEILIGHYASMTGSEATFGRSTDNGITLAVDEINAAGGIDGKKVRVITYDDKGDAREAGTAVTRLVTSDHVVAVLGEVASSLSLVAAPVCQQNHVPMVSPSSTNPKVTKIGDMIFRVCFIDPFQGLVCAKFARENLKATRAAILYDQTGAYSVGLNEEFAKGFVKLSGQIVSRETYQAGDQDFSAQLIAIRASRPDVIFVPGYYTDIGNIAIQARRLGIKVPLLGGDGWDSDKLGEIGGKSIDGSYYSNHYSHQDPNPLVQDFIRKYKERFGNTPDGLAALGYDAARVLCEAIGRARSVSGADIAAELAKTQNFNGVTGKISIDKDRNAVKPAVMLEMLKGEPTYVSTIEPETGAEDNSNPEIVIPPRQWSLADFVQILVCALAVGSLYALIALGYTMVYGILQFINFAHSDVVVLGAWISYTLSIRLLPLVGINARSDETVPPLWVAGVILLAAMLFCSVVGYLIERLAYRPLRKAPRLNVLITAIGVSLLLQNVGQLNFLFGAIPQKMPALLPDLELVRLSLPSSSGSSTVVIGVVDAIIIGTSIVLMLVLQYMVYRTKIGTAMRAVAFNLDAASLMGVPVDQVVSFTFVLGSALAAAAGFLFVLKYPELNQPAHSTWIMLGLKAFVAAVIGGIGNVRGAVLGGFVIAAAEQFGAFYLSSSYRDVYVFALLILILLVRPSGLMGSTVQEKV
ncbi:MAG TPA: ABC transporter substrate-binding protein [Lacipirellulaceae bacterium]|nr:ABC transporter substrate-binding protein [Lacipirellulaceae bacterium]